MNTVGRGACAFALAAAGFLGGMAFEQGRGERRTSPVATHPLGAPMPDGTIYAGVSTAPNQDLFTTPADAPGFFYNWNMGKAWCETLVAHGHDDWRLPTGKGQEDELNVLFQNKAKIGGFNKTTLFRPGWYWSSTTFPVLRFFARMQCFDDGGRDLHFKDGAYARVRCVRTEPRP